MSTVGYSEKHELYPERINLQKQLLVNYSYLGAK